MIKTLKKFKDVIIIKGLSSFEESNDLDIFIKFKKLKHFILSLKKLGGKIIYNFKNKEIIVLIPLKIKPFFKRIHIQTNKYFKNFKYLEENKELNKKYKLFILNKKAYASIKKNKRKSNPKICYITSKFIKRKSIKIALMGIDGSGKSTIKKTLKNELSKNFRVKERYMGWNDFSLFAGSLYSIINKFRKKSSNSQEELKEYYPERLSLPYMLVYYCELLTRYLALLPQIILGKTIIFDRYFYDKLGLLDKKSLKFKLFNMITPKPDFVLYIRTDTKIIFKRKKEFTQKALNLKDNIMMNCLSEFKGVTIINNNKSLDNTIYEIIKKIRHKLMNKNEIINV